MDDTTRFAVCGIDCMRCSIHLRTEEELKYWRARNVDLDRIACDGCRSDRNGCHWSGDCALLICCLYEKKLDFCGECPDFPCQKVSEWAEEWEHHSIAVESMKEMKAVGKENWIRQRLAEASRQVHRDIQDSAGDHAPGREDKMSPTALAYERLIERFVAWIHTQPGIYAAMVVGSRARADHPPDEWSDLDIVMGVADPEPYLTDADWLKNMGDARITFVEPTVDGGSERRALFSGGLDVDFAVIPYDKLKLMIEHGVPPAIAGMLRRGVRVLLDREGLATRLSWSDGSPTPPSSASQAEFIELISDFWYHAVLTAKKLRRGELWYAKACADGYMKRQLLKMIEWHARTIDREGRDTWHDGRFMEHWADLRVLEGLRPAFAHYGRDDIGRALLATMDLFRWVAKEVAERKAFAYPMAADEYATELVGTLLSPDNQICIGDGP